MRKLRNAVMKLTSSWSSLDPPPSSSQRAVSAMWTFTVRVEALGGREGRAASPVKVIAALTSRHSIEGSGGLRRPAASSVPEQKRLDRELNPIPHAS